MTEIPDHTTPEAPASPATGDSLQATRILRDAIVSCVLPPGARLSEVVLARDFDIGRGALRAALRALQESGLVSSSPRSGWRVTPVSAPEIREVCAARRHLEPILTTATLDELAREKLAALAGRHAALMQRFDDDPTGSAAIRAAEREIIESVAEALSMPMVQGWLNDLWDRSVRLVNFFEDTGPVRYTPAPRARLVQALTEGRRNEALEHLQAANRALETWLLERFLESGARVQSGRPAPARRRRAAQVTS
ncbi:GntR family transcriptional regulator [Falsigemmobacter intermedius]|nr:GntR family transcriptional regulator [Falsigemmobacter intermedius]